MAKLFYVFVASLLVGANRTYCRDQNYSGSGKMFPGINFGKIADFIAGRALSGINDCFQ